jgi:hypothetical protein
MKCPGCNADVADGSKTCAQCGHELSVSTRAMGETTHLAKATGAELGKVGRGVEGGVKKLGSAIKKDLKREK